MYWCKHCKQVWDDDQVVIAREHYEAWGHEFYTEDKMCPDCRESLEDYEGQDEEEKMDEIREIVDELTDEICNKFCKYSGTGKDGKCDYCTAHNNKCPLDKIMKEVGLI